MGVLLLFMASITGGVWCAYFVEYREDKKMRKEAIRRDRRFA